MECLKECVHCGRGCVMIPDHPGLCRCVEHFDTTQCTKDCHSCVLCCVLLANHQGECRCTNHLEEVSVKEKLFKMVDLITAKWVQIESKIAHFEIACAPLSIKRIGERMRLCYNGKPVEECKAVEKIEAAFHLGKLTKAIESEDSAQVLKAETALEILNKIVRK